MKPHSPTGGLVYSTDGGRMCPACRQPQAACRCSAATPLPPTDGIVRVSRETKGRGGKAVTLVRGLVLDPVALAAELTAWVRERKGAVQAPKVIDFVDALPMTGLGKLDKKAIRAKFWQGQQRAVH